MTIFFGVFCLFLGMILGAIIENSFRKDEQVDECTHEFDKWYEYSVLTQQRECSLCGYVQKKEKGK